MCWHSVTLCLNLKLFFFNLEAKERGEFTALQLLALVTVNRPLSGAVKVFYGPVFEPGLCQGSHLWGEQSYWRPRLPRHRKTQEHDYWWWHFSIPLAPSFSPLPVPYPSAFDSSRCHTTARQSDCSSVGSGVLCFLFMNGDFAGGIVPPRRYLDDKKTRAFYKVLPQREEDICGGKRKKGVF